VRHVQEARVRITWVDRIDATRSIGYLTRSAFHHLDRTADGGGAGVLQGDKEPVGPNGAASCQRAVVAQYADGVVEAEMIAGDAAVDVAHVEPPADRVVGSAGVEGQRVAAAGEMRRGAPLFGGAPLRVRCRRRSAY